jgi:predicted TIM-barrel fold metal-dependent hydrolase
MTDSIHGVAHAAPDFAVPAGACDCHTHVFGPAARYPFAPGRTYTPGDASIENLLALHRRLGIERVVIVHPSPYGADNACTVDALGIIGPGARGVAVIDDAVSETELDDMHTAGVRGVRVNLETAGIADPAQAVARVLATARRVASRGWHVQTFTRPAIVAALAGVISEMPVPLVIDHFGHMRAEKGLDQPGFADLLRMLGSGRAYVKLSAAQRISNLPDCSDAQVLAQALIDANPERVLWGSDWPHPGGKPGVGRNVAVIEPFNPVDDGVALNRIARWAGSAERICKLLAENPARLYGF